MIAQLLELALRARAGGQRLRGRALGGGIRGALHVVAGLIQLLALLRHLRLIFGPVHALAQFIHVREHLLLLLLEPFQPALDFLPFLLGARLLQGRLQFFEPVVQVLLPPGQFLQTVLRLQLFPALGVPRRLRLALRFVTVLRLGHLHLLELALHLLLASAATLLVAALIAHDLVLVLLQLQQRLIGRLLGRQGLGEGRWRVRGSPKALDGFLHFQPRGGPQGRRARILLLFRRGLRLLEGL